MDSWRSVWRVGFEPQLSTRALVELRRGLLVEDQRLLQKHTTMPPNLSCTADFPVEGGCPLSYGLWRGDGLKTVREVESRWYQLVQEADRRLGEDRSFEHFISWVDETPRAEMCRLLLEEVDLALLGRLPDYLRRLLPGLESAATVRVAE